MDSRIARSKISAGTIFPLWGIAAGRCEICNQILYLDPAFGTSGNFAEKAHICGVGQNGPRHKNSMTKDEVNRIDNLMLLCPSCHKMIDNSPDDFAEGLLIKLKREHEDRVRLVTDIKGSQTCRMVTYFVNIDSQKEVFDENLFRWALILAQRVPLQSSIIELHDSTDTRYSADKFGFEKKASALSANFRDMFGRIHDKESIAVFALAPQPLLIKLGTLINDQYNAMAFQCHREGHKWAWKEGTAIPEFLQMKTRESNSNKVALVIDLSGPVKDERITSILGEDITIYHFTLKNHNRNFVSNVGVQGAFINAIRPFIEEIKNSKQRPSIVHVFPVMPASLNVRFGMDYMPKADLPWVIYEQADTTDGFFETITIGGTNHD